MVKVTTTKERIQNVVFPHGLVIDPQSRTYLSKNTNTLFSITNRLSVDEGLVMKKQVSILTDRSFEAAGRVELSNLLEDYYLLAGVFDKLAM